MIRPCKPKWIESHKYETLSSSSKDFGSETTYYNYTGAWPQTSRSLSKWREYKERNMGDNGRQRETTRGTKKSAAYGTKCHGDIGGQRSERGCRVAYLGPWVRWVSGFCWEALSVCLCDVCPLGWVAGHTLSSCSRFPKNKIAKINPPIKSINSTNLPKENHTLIQLIPHNCQIKKYHIN